MWGIKINKLERGWGLDVRKEILTEVPIPWQLAEERKI